MKLLILLFAMNVSLADGMHDNFNWNNSMYNHANTAAYLSNQNQQVQNINYRSPNQQRDQQLHDFNNYNNYPKERN